ncbi:hypothetical protein PBCVNEJV1_140L [Paramecium bursaria Chlorella virus NE-JV-1]|nr:hypothetical protein PBCVNEJV1_140L [Paramecium bursaria Chlorella virus NE-JV-1]
MSIFDQITSTTGKVTNVAKDATKEIVIRFADMLVAAAGIVAALSWNSAVQSLFAEGGALHRFAKGGVWISAILITLFAIGIGFWRTKLIPPTPKKQ